jgi:hypothetical protein
MPSTIVRTQENSVVGYDTLVTHCVAGIILYTQSYVMLVKSHSTPSCVKGLK